MRLDGARGARTKHELTQTPSLVLEVQHRASGHPQGTGTQPQPRTEHRPTAAAAVPHTESSPFVSSWVEIKPSCLCWLPTATSSAWPRTAVTY